MSNQFSPLEANSLEGALLRSLGIPRRAPAKESTQRADPLAPAFSRLQQELARMRASMDALGVAPAGYPPHVKFVITCIGSLLPWYTRPIREFGRATSNYCSEMAGILGSLSSEVERLRNERR